ncbi:MAG: 3-alpha,7-alpha, 12-alpha-trihydroxy-5-beta-cholest-24-enoyl-CoA hydratase [Caballeronia sp.]|jgi:acyl dehydratase|uniref:MaoC/PaaZ C-terminal domain-containing protein n=1 Tax=Caballeronia sp. TaxID=1931223 RepID=UPI00262F47C6|nr:MaoC/PaaZ C-terminal domain-containing protein [Caballeronia sp.]MDB5837702.1 3-alpha,7-alpha, 12-alpha-trihydroxy-5-beta-cholest-24-enoyl-CoA hydratase [Caballeronia sp.]
MPIDYQVLRNWKFTDVPMHYDERDTMLYGLSLGFGDNPLDASKLRFVYEKNLVAVPSMAAILGYPGNFLNDPATGVDYLKVVHGEQSVELHRPLPVTARIVGRSRVSQIVDKGRGKGALVTVERKIVDALSGELFATVEQVIFCRGDGGFATEACPGDPPAPAPEVLPDAPPDAVFTLPTRTDAALLYRLLGDRNHLHADPDVARAAGFARPILQGLATYGLAARAVIETCCGDDPGRLVFLYARFSAPVFPGETLRAEVWRDGEAVRFRIKVIERDVVAINNGMATIGQLQAAA